MDWVEMLPDRREFLSDRQMRMDEFVCSLRKPERDLFNKFDVRQVSSTPKTL